MPMGDNIYVLRDGIKIRTISKPFCNRCSKPISEKEGYTYCNDCCSINDQLRINAVGLYLKWHEDVQDSVSICSDYPTNKAILKLKTDPGQAEVLGKCMVDMIESEYRDLRKIELIVPVPKGTTGREFNQSALLAKYISDKVGMTFKDILLDKGKKRPQHMTPYAEKEQNVKDTIECNEDLGGKSVLLIDDVCTSGYTLKECASVLRKCGAGEIREFVFAKEVSIKHIIVFINQGDKYL
jgi:predicted amidophosphoribosyltransferase